MTPRQQTLLCAPTFLVIAICVFGCNSAPPTPVAKALTVSCDSTTLSAIQQQAHCSARVSLTDGSTIDATAAAQWSSSDSAKVTVVAGTITAVAPGSADIIATFENITGRQALNVSVGCTFTITPDTISIGGDSATQSVTITATPAGCSPSAWTASTSDSSLTVSPSAGEGNGTVTVSIAANTTGNPQTRSATIAGQTVTVKQAAACAFTVSPSTITFSSSGGTQLVTVTPTPKGCSPATWSATSTNPGITVSPASGEGNGTVTLTAAANTGAEQTWTATIAGRTVSVTESAAMYALHLTLVEGENLSGPHAGTVTGPNGFTCTFNLTRDDGVCSQRFAAGTSVPLVVKIAWPGFPPGAPTPDARPIAWSKTKGCDVLAGSDTCIVNMNGDRDVTIAIGCEVGCFAPDAVEEPSTVSTYFDQIPRQSAWRSGR